MVDIIRLLPSLLLVIVGNFSSLNASNYGIHLLVILPDLLFELPDVYVLLHVVTWDFAVLSARPRLSM